MEREWNRIFKRKKKTVSRFVDGFPTNLGRCVRQPRHFDSRRRLMDEFGFLLPTEIDPENLTKSST